METVCEVCGYECVLSEETGEQSGYRIFATRPLSASASGEGTETLREYISCKYIDYTPVLGDKVVFIKNQRGFNERVIKF